MRTVACKNVGVEIDFHEQRDDITLLLQKLQRYNAIRPRPLERTEPFLCNPFNFFNNVTILERLYRLRLRDFFAALFAGATRVIGPKILHRLTEMLDDIGAIEVDILDQCSAIIAIKDDVFMFTRRPAPFHNNADGVRRPHRRMGDIRRDEECLPFSDEMIDDTIAFANAHFDVAFELVKIFLGIDQMKIVPRVRTFDYHDEKIATIIKITVTHRWFKLVAVLFDPVHEIDWWLHRALLCG
jgi:hypothetical protein